MFGHRMLKKYMCLVSSTTGMKKSNEMQRVEPEEMGVFELFVPGAKKGQDVQNLSYETKGKAISFTKQIHMQIMQNCVRELHL